MILTILCNVTNIINAEVNKQSINLRKKNSKFNQIGKSGYNKKKSD